MKRRSATRPSQRQTTPTSTRTGCADEARSSSVQSKRSTASRKRSPIGVRLVTLGEIGNQEAEFVAAEAGVKILRSRGAEAAPARAGRQTAPAREAAARPVR